MTDSDSEPRKLIPEERYALRVYRMLAELHRRGYERLRIVPGMSSSGCHYRTGITSSDNVYADHGALTVDHDRVAHNTSGNGARLFTWRDAPRASIAKLATMFVERFPTIAARGFGPDPDYVDWLPFAIDVMKRGESPIAYSDYDLPGSVAPASLPTNFAYEESTLPMPPPGASLRRYYSVRTSPEDERVERAWEPAGLQQIDPLGHLNRIW